MVIEQIDPKALKPYKNNAKIHTEEQVGQIQPFSGGKTKSAERRCF